MSYNFSWTAHVLGESCGMRWKHLFLNLTYASFLLGDDIHVFRRTWNLSYAFNMQQPIVDAETYFGLDRWTPQFCDKPVSLLGQKWRPELVEECEVHLWVYGQRHRREWGVSREIPVSTLCAMWQVVVLLLELRPIICSMNGLAVQKS